ncbi:hypothetical protein PQX77_020859 [Marasmius sp. AFHP31]|nr:hypothetical protein PQX77_020859 [Marasmius sp. AFHP31]
MADPDCDKRLDVLIRRDIPYDVLVEIFTYLMGPILFDQSAVSIDTGERRRAGALCRRWREAMVATPALWSEFGVIVARCPGRPECLEGGCPYPKPVMENLCLFLARSEKYPLQIMFQAQSPGLSPLDIMPAPLTVLLDHSDRWVSLKLPLGGVAHELGGVADRRRDHYILSYPGAPYHLLLPRLHHMPNLRSIWIRYLPSGSPGWQRVLSHLLCPPTVAKNRKDGPEAVPLPHPYKLKLTSMTLWAAPDHDDTPVGLTRWSLPDPCKYVTSLKATFSPGVAVSVLGQMGSLVRASIHLAHTQSLDVGRGRCACPKLRELCVNLPSDKNLRPGGSMAGAYPHGYAGHLLDGISCPVLESFALVNPWGRLKPFGNPVPSRDKFIPRDICSLLTLSPRLKELRLSGIPLHTAHIVEILEIAATLISLELVEQREGRYSATERVVTQDLCEWLGDATNLPRLQKLHLGIVSGIEDADRIMSTLERRGGAERVQFRHFEPGL